tara:strand:+ start:517 stop:627 length:111 start_codon:yes stop_codon:yes gene_type:complete
MIVEFLREIFKDMTPTRFAIGIALGVIGVCIVEYMI